MVQTRPPANSPLELRQRTLGEIVQAAVQLWGANWRRVFPVTAAIVLPFQIIGVLVSLSVKPTIVDSLQDFQKRLQDDPTAVPGITGRQWAAAGAGRLIIGLGSTIVTATLTVIIADAYLQRTRSRAEVLRVARRRGPINLLSWFLGLLVAAIPVGGFLVAAYFGKFSSQAVIVGLLPALLIAVLLQSRLQSASASIVVEQIGAISALKRGVSLSRKRGAVVFAAMIIMYFIIPIPGAIIAAMITGVLSSFGGANPSFEFLWTAIGGTVAEAIIAPLIAGVAVLMYFDLRIRSEGFDLEKLAASVKPGASGSPNSETTNADTKKSDSTS
jgi:MFS family permease